MLLVGLVSCGGGDKKEENKEPEKTTEQKDTKIPKDLKGDFKDTGDGLFYITTSEGDSKDGNVPVLLVGKDDKLVQMEAHTENMYGDYVNIYIDKKLVVSQDDVGSDKILLDIEGDNLKPGKHMVEVTQYKDNDPEKELETYKTAEYEVKEK